MTGTPDIIIVGSGPNGLAAAIFLQQQGLSTCIYEAAGTPGGAVRTFEITLPGFRHDICSAIHPLAFSSPFFKNLPLTDFGLSWIFPEIPFAHPLENGLSLAVFRDISQTAAFLGKDGTTYRKIFERLTADWESLQNDVLGPLSWPADLRRYLRFIPFALPSASRFVHSHFSGDDAKTLFFGAAAHSALDLDRLSTAAFGVILIILAHTTGWPFPKGGASSITEALTAYYESLGGKIILNTTVSDLAQLPPARVFMLDMTPRQVLALKGTNLNPFYRKRLERYRYGAGAFKVDWALKEPIPFTDDICRKAGTIHLGYSWKEIGQSEKSIHHGKPAEKPYVLLAQHSVFDKTRAPEGFHTAWAYCHVPHANPAKMTHLIESQIEKAAPGFRDCILHRAVHNAEQLEKLNPNLVGGDINGGRQDITQLFTRPVARISPYTTSNPKLYICSSSTPPGGGVHGMCGYHAARKVLRDHFS